MKLRQSFRAVTMSAAMAATMCGRSPDAVRSADPGVPITLRITESRRPAANLAVWWLTDEHSALTAEDAGRHSGLSRSDGSGIAVFAVPSGAPDGAILAAWVEKSSGWRRVVLTDCPTEPSSYDVDIGGSPTQHSARVRVTDSHGVPIRGASVRVVVDREAGPDPTVEPTTTGGGGEATTPPVDHESFPVDVEATGFAPVRFLPLVETGEPDHVDDVVLPESEEVVISYRNARTGDWLEVQYELVPMWQKWRHRFDDESRSCKLPLPSGQVALRAHRGDKVIAESDLAIGPDTKEVVLTEN